MKISILLEMLWIGIIRSGNYNYYENYPVSVRGRGTGGNNGSGTFRIVLYLI